MRIGLHLAEPASTLGLAPRRRRAARGVPIAGQPNDMLAHTFAPRVHGRQLRTGRDDWPRSDQPLAMVAEVERHADGTARISYSALFSNEDGGTETRELLARWGRTTDYEGLYSVSVGRDGRIVAGSERYQARNHTWRRFAGPHDAGRAVLHVSTANNMLAPGAGASQRVIDASDLLVLRRDRQTRRPDALDIMSRVPNAWRDMAREVRREGKVTPAGGIRVAGERIEDPRRYVYIAGAPRAGTRIRVTLSNGRTVIVRVPARDVPDGRSVAVALPDGVRGADVTRIQQTARARGAELYRSVTVLGDDDQPHVFDVRGTGARRT